MLSVQQQDAAGEESRDAPATSGCAVRGEAQVLARVAVPAPIPSGLFWPSHVAETREA